MQPDEPSRYNKIFEKLVVSQEENSEERLIGMLAYAEYKLDKYEWMCSKPQASSIEIEAFLDLYNERKLNKYRTDAFNVLLSYASQYADALMQEQLTKLRDEGISQELKTVKSALSTELTAVQNKLENDIKETKSGWMKPVWQGVVSSLIFTSFLFVLALLIRFAAPNSSIGQLLQYLSAPDAYELKVIEKNKRNP